MRTGIKVLSTVCGVIILIGVILALMGLAFGGSLTSDPTEEVTLEAVGAVSSVEIDAAAIDVEIKRSEDGRIYAVCDSSDKVSYELKLDGGALRLIENDKRKWYDRIGFFFGERDAVLYLPEGAYSALSVEISSGSIYCSEQAISFADTELETTSGNIIFKGNTEKLSAEATSGSISISDCAAKEIELSASSGSIKAVNTSADIIEASTISGGIRFENVKAAEGIELQASSGSIRLNSVISENKLYIKAISGSIIFDGCDGRDINTECSSGSIKGSILTGKAYDVRASSGSVSYPDEIHPEGGTFRARASSGNIKITVVNQ